MVAGVELAERGEDGGPGPGVAVADRDGGARLPGLGPSAYQPISFGLSTGGVPSCRWASRRTGTIGASTPRSGMRTAVAGDRGSGAGGGGTSGLEEGPAAGWPRAEEPAEGTREAAERASGCRSRCPSTHRRDTATRTTASTAVLARR